MRALSRHAARRLGVATPAPRNGTAWSSVLPHFPARRATIGAMTSRSTRSATTMYDICQRSRRASSSVDDARTRARRASRRRERASSSEHAERRRHRLRRSRPGRRSRARSPASVWISRSSKRSPAASRTHASFWSVAAGSQRLRGRRATSPSPDPQVRVDADDLRFARRETEDLAAAAADRGTAGRRPAPASASRRGR